ncbi:fatty acid biosynthesis transcriptional regulator [Staphylococcus microti]|uniref:Fatty acid biosynthesis transcriptional regulator n=1 Tax=Staphylococcus microti TaxID=569857 RepID=A0A0D6XNN4_9STAP|nr:transcription factor FapR [Staphylococcus microti]KIX90287.1 fatty acid biosynthesis transcriptional regulator [Staphylococcus microti]SUM57266.1 fatty acid biosynthesis transcriptional regulator [Staphylococcus microti]
MKRNKNERRKLIEQTIQQNPFITDQALSEMYDVSIQTIRLDRNQLHIPELRERVKRVATEQYEQISSLENQDIIGDIVALEPNRSAKSLLTISPQDVFTRNNIARGHIVFAQANSLCVAMVKHGFVLTKESHIHFVKPVHLGDSVVAEAKVEYHDDKYYEMTVISYVGEAKVFEGLFKMYYISEDE